LNAAHDLVDPKFKVDIDRIVINVACEASPSFRRPRDQFECRIVGESLCRALELRKHLKRILCAARQHDLVFDEGQAVIRDNNQVGNAGFSMVTELVGTLPLREPSDHLRAPFADRLWNRAPQRLGKERRRGKIRVGCSD